MRGAAALLLCAAAACAPMPSSEHIVLYPDMLSLPLLDGGHITNCPETRSGDRQVRVRQVCVQFAPGQHKQARDYYRDHMIYVARWTRVRTDETATDGWILPGVPDTHCLFVTVYAKPDMNVVAEFQLATIESETGRVDACDMSIG